jgi:hypothetical protein
MNKIDINVPVNMVRSAGRYRHAGGPNIGVVMKSMIAACFKIVGDASFKTYCTPTLLASTT